MRTAMIGVSHWHASRQALSFRAAGCQIVAVSDPNPAALEAFEPNENLVKYSDHSLLLERENLDFAIVLGTPLEMPKYVLDVLAAGLPLAVEKPLAINASSLEPIMKAARGHFVAVALANRYSGIWDALTTLELSNQAGRRQQASFRLLNGLPTRYLRDSVAWVLDPHVSGGGALRNLGIHAVDAFLEFAGHQAVKIKHVRLSYGQLNLEEHALVILESSDGIAGMIEVGYTYPSLEDGGDYEWRLGTKNAYLLERSLARQHTRLEVQVLHQKPKPEKTSELGERYAAFALDTISRLRANQPPRVTLEELHRAMQLIDQIYALKGDT
jgi:predicted dehydrogenase